MIQKYLKKLDKEIERWIKSGNNLRNIILIGVAFAVLITVKIINATFGQTYGSVKICDKTYKTVVISNKTWMAENLDCPHTNPGSKCYNNDPLNCHKYGRLYTWYIAKKICPRGWHLPTNNEWEVLIDKKSAEKFGFAPLLGGIGVPFPSTSGTTIGANFYNIDHSGYWWTSTDFNIDNAIARNIFVNEERINWSNIDKFGLFSVRCVMDS